MLRNLAPLENRQAEAQVGDTIVVLDPSGAAYIQDGRVLIVSDMHLEKGTSWARRGIFLPPYDSYKTLKLLSATVQKFEPEVLIFLGDSFHDAKAADRLLEQERLTVKDISNNRDLIWITGNHDPEIPTFLPGVSVSELIVGGLHFTHVPEKNAASPQISGHLHPVAIVSGRGRNIRRRCFASDGQRLILPAFGAYTGGLNVRDKAFDGLFQSGKLVTHVIGEERIYSLAATTL